MLTLDDIQKILAAVWNAPHTPSIISKGTKFELSHPFGQTVDFDMKRSDLILSAADFANKVLTPAVNDLRKAIA